VAGIGTALESGYRRISSGENVNDFSFTFVSPLETEYYVYFAHLSVLYIRGFYIL
jgi:hypothetical protein